MTKRTGLQARIKVKRASYLFPVADEETGKWIYEVVNDGYRLWSLSVQHLSSL